MELNWLTFALLVLASFRLTRLIVFDKITWFIRKPFHEIIEEEENGVMASYIKIKGSGLRKWIGELLSCYWCTGVWAAVLLIIGWALFPNAFFYAVLILAISGGAGIIEDRIDR